MITKQDLVDIVKKYNDSLTFDEENKIKLAYDFANNKHKGQLRGTGEEYFTHPLQVAIFAAETYHLDTNSIISALLHDVVEDTDTNINEIENLFGIDVANIVDGLTKLRILSLDKTTEKAENYKKFISFISQDIRVLLIKLLDRCHNILTLNGHKNEEKKQRIATETLALYVPFAERLGMSQLKTFLEDECFKVLYPAEYNKIYETLNKFKQNGMELASQISNEFKDLMKKNDINADIIMSETNIYTIWKKQKNKKIEFENIFDILSFNFITDSIENCYKILGIIHTNYKSIPNRFKDFISISRPNYYRSIHTAILMPNGLRVKIQIKTKEMDNIAKYGIGYNCYFNTIENKSFDWIKYLSNSVNKITNADEVIETLQLSSFIDSIFCFTPKGDAWDMPLDSTVLDFAYRVHTNLGNSCIGAKINKVIQNINTKLQNGDMIEILTANEPQVMENWKNIVITTKAKKQIEKYLSLNKK